MVSFSRGIECHIVIATGLDAFFSAETGHVAVCAPADGPDATASPATATTTANSTPPVLFIAALLVGFADVVSGAIMAHPLTAPAVRPRTSCFWKARSRITSGSTAMIAPGEGDVHLVDGEALELLEPDLHGAVLVVLGDEQRPEVLVPRGEEGEHRRARPLPGARAAPRPGS